MAFEMLVGLNVVDAETYRKYREQMTPLLHACGGSFRYDFEILETLQSEAPHPINRMFVLSFPSKNTRDQFFQDEKYRQIRRECFDPSVAGATVIAEFDRN